MEARTRDTSGAATTQSPAAIPPGHAERPVRILLVASLILPLLIFLGASYLSYRQHFAEAADRLNRSVVTVYEHAKKVFETFDVTAAYVEQLIDDVTNEEVSRNEADYHRRLKRLTDTLPQLRDIWVVDENGHPIVSGTLFPMPRDVELADRDYFKILKEDARVESFLTEVFPSRAANRQLFLISRRRLYEGQRTPFRGVTTTAVAPEYFSDYYAQLPGHTSDSVMLLRDDGAILSRYPPLATSSGRLVQGSPLLAAIQQSDRGNVTLVSPVDGVRRMFSFRKLPRHGAYVVVGTATSSIVERWLWNMSGHLIFGVPATLALLALSWMALSRTRREGLAYDQLRAEVARREVTEHALRQAQKMEAVGRLTGGIAHDFNNLLTAVMGNIDLITRRITSDDERITRPLASVKEAATRAAALVQRLLAFSRQQPHEVKIVDPNRLVRDMSDLLARTIGETVTIETVLAAGLWKIAIDSNELESAILNLAVNARDAMPAGGRLTIETANTYLDEEYIAKEGGGVPAGQYVMVAISDTGTGMSREVVEQAFEPFFTTKPKGVGTGLGLSMVYGFVRQSGGHVKIYSEVGEGTAIKMYFPRGHDQREHVPVAPRAEPLPSPTSRTHETILLVEDDENVARFAVEVLRELGYEVLSAADAVGALAVLDERPNIDLLFTDVVLPGGMNGRQLAQAANQKIPGLKVLFATGYTRNAIVHHGRLDPGVEVLMKPYSYDALARKVRAILDRELASS
jgi:two-component system NtrC family sensor kinase